MQFAKLDITTDVSGNATVTFTMPDFKPPTFLYAVEWVDGTLADGVDAVLTAINTASGVNQTLLTLTNANDDAWYYPRVTESTNTGAAGSGTAIPIFTGDLQLVVSSGGNAATGSCIVYFSF